jgi:hypothetical protein
MIGRVFCLANTLGKLGGKSLIASIVKFKDDWHLKSLYGRTLRRSVIAATSRQTFCDQSTCSGAAIVSKGSEGCEESSDKSIA